MMDCPDEQTLRLFSHVTTLTDTWTTLAAHVNQCALCQTRLDAYLRTEPPAFCWPPVPRDRWNAAPPVAPPRELTEALPHIPGYEVLRVLGWGGTAIVYEARHLKLERSVALKLLAAERLHERHAAERFTQEARVLARLQHPNIIHVYDLGSVAERPYFSLELLTGRTLADWLDGQPQPPWFAVQVVSVLASAVGEAHRQAILHRDLKPANILLPATSPGAWPAVDRLKVTDFGLAKILDPMKPRAPLTDHGALIGTPQYMSPEQARLSGEPVGPPTDVYSLGVVLYELLTGQPPFPLEVPIQTLYRVCHEEPPPLRSPTFPPALVHICATCMAKDARQRYPTATALAADLQRLLGKVTPLHVWPTPPPQPRRGWHWLRPWRSR